MAIVGEKTFLGVPRALQDRARFSMMVENVDAVPEPLTTSTNTEEGR
jgi:hypothetical protein